MSMEIVMPKTGLTNTENTLDSWSVAEGDTVTKGQVLGEIESEKTTMPLESLDGGIIHLLAKAGDTVSVGGVIAYLAGKGYSATYGARNLQRLIQKDIEDAIATEIIDNLKGAAKTVGLTVQDGKITVLAL